MANASRGIPTCWSTRFSGRRSPEFAAPTGTLAAGEAHLLVNGRPPEIYALYAFAAAVLCAWVLVPATEWVAHRINAIETPNERSIHVVPTPKLGGLAMLAGVLVAGVLFLPWAPVTRAILVGAVLIAAVGVADDVFDLPAWIKLVGQIVAAM